MAAEESTSWTLIRDAAGGKEPARVEFARRYAPALGAYFRARWRSAHPEDVEDGVQEALLECFRTGGALEKADPAFERGFRALLYGVARHVALRAEERWRLSREREPGGVDLARIQTDEAPLSAAFDRAWAESLMREAALRHEERARAGGAEALRRFELLRLHFQEGVPLNELAGRWSVPPLTVYRQHALARREFKEALLEVLAFHNPGATRGELERESAGLRLLLEQGRRPG